jgi:hypothetical protein
MFEQGRVQAQKLAEARRALMAPHPQGETHSFEVAFKLCDQALRDLDMSTVLDDEGRAWVGTVSDAIGKSAEDMSVIRPAVAAVLAVAVAFILVVGACAENPPRGKADPAIYSDLRGKALAGSRAAFGLAPSKSPTEPWGLLMETGFADGGSCTVVAIADGSASVYLSSGGGFIGGGTQETIRKAAQATVTMAARFQPQMKLTKSFPLPAGGQTTFYVLTDAGVFTASAPEDDLVEERHSLSSLFHAGQEVVTQYRLTLPGR